MVKAHPEIPILAIQNTNIQSWPAKHSQDLRGAEGGEAYFRQGIDKLITRQEREFVNCSRSSPSSLNGTCSSDQSDGASSRCLLHRHSILPAVLQNVVIAPLPAFASLFSCPSPPFLPFSAGWLVFSLRVPNCYWYGNWYCSNKKVPKSVLPLPRFPDQHVATPNIVRPYSAR